MDNINLGAVVLYRIGGNLRIVNIILGNRTAGYFGVLILNLNNTLIKVQQRKFILFLLFNAAELRLAFFRRGLLIYDDYGKMIMSLLNIPNLNVIDA